MSLFCPIRHIHVTPLPEEKVRQALLHQMIHSLGYPKGLIVVEKSLADLPHLQGKSVPDCRVDIVVFHPVSMHPLLLVECKATPLNSKVERQLIGYNLYVQAPFISLANPEGAQICTSQEKNEWVPWLPSYQELMKNIASSKVEEIPLHFTN